MFLRLFLTLFIREGLSGRPPLSSGGHLTPDPSCHLPFSAYRPLFPARFWPHRRSPVPTPLSLSFPVVASPRFFTFSFPFPAPVTSNLQFSLLLPDPAPLPWVGWRV